MGDVTLNELIEMAIRQRDWDRKTYNMVRLGRVTKEYSRKLSNRFCPGLAEDLHNDICQEAFLKLFQRGEAALDELGGKKLFRECVIAAIRTTNAVYTEPGQLRRKTNSKLPPARVAAYHVGTIADSAALSRGTVADDSGSYLDFDKFESATAASEVKRIEDAIDIAYYMRLASPSVQRALHLICFDGERSADAAADAGVSRFTLKRQLDAFFDDCRAA